ncbi:class I SAM-dependent RNA methyltransferase [Gordonia sp. OPL2]|nr:class I SAM-dependent RNA methyltransferase [Gordonia sp. OPL2]
MVVRPDRPANGGEAVGRIDGQVVFVRGAVPGELIRAQVVDDRRASFRRAEVIEILEPSPHRVVSPCDAARHGAGCCDLGYIEVSHARTLKAQIVSDALSRIGRFDDADLTAAGVDDVVVRSLGDDGTGWRVRTRLGVDDDGRAGMHAFHGSRIVTGHRCAAPTPGLVDGLDDLALTPGAELAIVADMHGRRHVTELAPVAPPARRARGRRGDRTATQSARRRRESDRAQRVVEGDTTAAHRVGDRVWQIPVTAFWQAHRAAPGVYADTIVGMIAAAGVRPRAGAAVAWDLYGGAGIFAAALLDQEIGGAAPAGVHVVESDPLALASAAETFADDDRVTLHRGEVATTSAALPSPDVVVLDPPRTGAGAAVIDAVTDADPGVIVHVGCDVGRFARDLALFAEQGYRPRDIRAFDAFPLTHHVEAIACLVPAHRGM